MNERGSPPKVEWGGFNSERFYSVCGRGRVGVLEEAIFFKLKISYNTE